MASLLQRTTRTLSYSDLKNPHRCILQISTNSPLMMNNEKAFSARHKSQGAQSRLFPSQL